MELLALAGALSDLHLHGLVLNASICYWQDQPGASATTNPRAVAGFNRLGLKLNPRTLQTPPVLGAYRLARV